MFGKRDNSSDKENLFNMKDTGKGLVKGSVKLVKTGVCVAAGAVALGLGIGAAQEYA